VCLASAVVIYPAHLPVVKAPSTPNSFVRPVPSLGGVFFLSVRPWQRGKTRPFHRNFFSVLAPPSRVPPHASSPPPFRLDSVFFTFFQQRAPVLPKPPHSPPLYLQFAWPAFALTLRLCFPNLSVSRLLDSLDCPSVLAILDGGFFPPPPLSFPLSPSYV